MKETPKTRRNLVLVGKKPSSSVGREDDALAHARRVDEQLASVVQHLIRTGRLLAETRASALFEAAPLDEEGSASLARKTSETLLAAAVQVVTLIELRTKQASEPNR